MSLFGSTKTLSVADLIVQTLDAIGVERIWGVTGDSLNAINDSLRRSGRIDWMHVRHEEVAAFSAGAEAAATGRLAVCAGSCGPGNLRADYVLPSKGLRILGSGIFWPAAGEPFFYLTDTFPNVPTSDHREVWVDLRVR